MPVSLQRDPARTAELLLGWLRGRLPECDALEISEISVPSGSGFSNETILLGLQWGSGPGTRASDQLVLRVKPTAHNVFMHANFELQYRLLSALDKESQVKVPEMLWYESESDVLGAPFFVMRRVSGAAASDNPSYNESGWIFDMTPIQRHLLWERAVDALVSVHLVPNEVVALLDQPGYGKSGFEQCLAYWVESFAWASQGRDQPVAQRALDWLLGNLPPERPTELSWGDARIGNMLFDGAEVRGVLDWEMAGLGGHRMDLAWWLFLDDYHSAKVPRLEGLGTRAETIARWESGTGQKAGELHWHEVFAGFRFSQVMMRLAQIMEASGVNVGSMEHDNEVTRLLSRKLQEAEGSA